MEKTKRASLANIQDFRDRVAEALEPSGAVLLNLIDVLAVGPRLATPVEATLNGLWGYDWTSLYAALRRAAEELAPRIDRADWLAKLRTARLLWLAAQPAREAPELEGWRVRILDATNYDRPKTKTVRVGYVHGSDGMRPGHGLSVLSERVGEGGWALPLEIAWIPVEATPAQFGAQQVVTYVARHGWQAEEVLTVDAHYTNEPFLRPLLAAGVNVLGRVRSNRCFYLPPPPYKGCGRPPVRGRKVKLNDGRTLPAPDHSEAVSLADGRRFEVARWDDVRLRQWAEQRLVLYRVIEYRRDGRRRYQRPLWLVFVPAQGDLPAPAAARALYGARFQVEHSLRFLKGELGLVSGQFFGPEAEGRVQVWVEMVATALWLLWALRPLAQEKDARWPQWWRSRRLTPGAIRRLAPGLLLRLGWHRPAPKRRGKSPGRAAGTRLEPQRRYRIYRKRARPAVA